MRVFECARKAVFAAEIADEIEDPVGLHIIDHRQLIDATMLFDMGPLVSIVMPAYNTAPWIEQAV